MLHYILFIITFAILLFYAYIKLKYPFWNNQPVYHTYDYFRYFYSVPYYVNRYRPYKTKFYDYKNVRTIQYMNINNDKKKQLLDMIQCYYINTDRIIHTIDNMSLDSYFSGQTEKPFVSIYYQEIYEQIVDPSFGSHIVSKYKPLGCITSRKINFWHLNIKNNNQNYTELPVYYIDFLCVGRNNKTTDIYRKLLQTHEYNQRIENPNIICSIIKKEIELFQGIVPFVKYNTYTYKLRNHKIPRLPKHYHVIQINTKNIDLYVDFFYNNNDYCSKIRLYDVLIFPDIGNIEEMIKNKILYIYCLKANENIYGFYFFKDTKMYYEDIECNTITFQTSVMNCLSSDIFYTGFLNSIKEIVKLDTSFHMLLFEDIGHNNIIMQYWNKKYTPIFTNKTAYYLYNYIYPGSPLNKIRMFILN